MTAKILTGKEPAAVQRAEVAGRVGGLAADGISVGLATLMIGNDVLNNLLDHLFLHTAPKPRFVLEGDQLRLIDQKPRAPTFHAKHFSPTIASRIISRSEVDGFSAFNLMSPS